MAKWQEQSTPIAEGNWRAQATPVQVVEPSQNLAQAAAAGGSRGVLGFLDIVPRGLAGAYNLITAPGRAILPEAIAPPTMDISPFSRVGGAFGLGTYQPQTPGEETAAFAGEVFGSSLVPGGIVTRMATLPGRALGTEAAATGGAILGGIAGETFGGEQGRTLGTIAGGLSPMAAPYAARRFVSPYGSEQFAERVAASQRQNVPITAGEAAGGSFLEKASSILPGGQRQAQTFQDVRAARMGERVEELVESRLPPRIEASSEAAGRQIRRGLDDWTETFRARQSELYDEVDALIPPDQMVSLSQTRQALDDLTTSEQYAELATAIDTPFIRRLRTALGETEEVPYEMLKTLRTRVGAKLESPGMLADAPTGELKSLYAALSRDMDDAAAAAGPEAERAARRASLYTKAGHQRVDDFLAPIRNKNLPEQAYTAALAGTKEGASRLRAIRKSVSPEQWDVVVAATLRRMGRARASERTTGEIAEETLDFSPETFLTNLGNMSKEARRALFTGPRLSDLETNLDDLVDIAQGIREQRQAAFNPSGTTGALGNVSWLSALPFINPMQTARLTGGVLGNMYMQRALQSPAMLDYLANPTAITPSGLGQIGRTEAVLNP